MTAPRKKGIGEWVEFWRAEPDRLASRGLLVGARWPTQEEAEEEARRLGYDYVAHYRGPVADMIRHPQRVR